MPNKAKATGKQSRKKVARIINPYNCKECNQLVHGAFTVCPRCGYFHQNDKARNDWTATIIK